MALSTGTLLRSSHWMHEVQQLNGYPARTITAANPSTGRLRARGETYVHLRLSRFKLAGPPTPRDTEVSNAYAIIHDALGPVCICRLIGLNSTDETFRWRFALLRAGWWRTAQRARLPLRPLRQSLINRAEALKRQVWVR